MQYIMHQNAGVSMVSLQTSVHPCRLSTLIFIIPLITKKTGELSSKSTEIKRPQKWLRLPHQELTIEAPLTRFSYFLSSLLRFLCFKNFRIRQFSISSRGSLRCTTPRYSCVVFAAVVVPSSFLRISASHRKFKTGAVVFQRTGRPLPPCSLLVVLSCLLVGFLSF